MGLQWERDERRRVMLAEMEQSIFKAIFDADTDYDDTDKVALQDYYAAWLKLDVPVPTGGKDVQAALDQSDALVKQRMQLWLAQGLAADEILRNLQSLGEELLKA